ncbi:MAG: VCBS repeat-containing protein [Fibrobacteria bacterium]|nr:VCBS repeat-containing protein [Fibrobacteria bacterium]
MNKKQIIVLILVFMVPSWLIAGTISRPVLRTTLPASWDENWLASPVAYDLDGDSAKEIIAARHSVIYVWNAAGALLWRAPVGESASSGNDHGASRQYASPVVGDLDGDGKGEIAIAYSTYAAVYEDNGDLKTGWPKSFPGSAGELRSIAASDLDGDGLFEILCQKTMEGPVTMVWDITGQAVSGWPQVSGCDDCNDYGGFNQNIGAVDFNGDGSLEVVSSYDICHIGIMHADGSPYPAHTMFSDAGPWASSVPMFHDIELAKQGWGADGNDRDEFTDSPPCFGDVDGDGKPEIILYSDHERAGEAVVKGNCLWVLNADMTRVPGFETPLCSGEPLFTGYKNNIVQVSPSPALADMNGEAGLDIIVPSYDGKIRCYSSGGALLWDYVFDDGSGEFMGASGSAIGDLDGDGFYEVVFTTYSTAEDVSHMIILSHGGTELFKIALMGRGSMSVPTLDDVDGDGSVEIIISLKDVLGGGNGGIQIWDVPSSQAGDIPWPTGRGNYLRNGQNPDDQKPNGIDYSYQLRKNLLSPDKSMNRWYNINGQVVEDVDWKTKSFLVRF